MGEAELTWSNKRLTICGRRTSTSVVRQDSEESYRNDPVFFFTSSSAHKQTPNLLNPTSLSYYHVYFCRINIT